MRTTARPYRPARPARPAVALAAALALVACGGGDDPTVTTEGAGGGAGSTAPQPTAVPGIDAAFNDVDVAFIRGMNPHHGGAIEMAELAATRAADPEVKALAEKIVAAQDPEIQMMEKMALAWGVDLEAGSDSMPGMDMGEDEMSGMDNGEDVAALEPLTGAAFDREFLTRMVVHHESAVEMAQVELAEGENRQAKQMAQDIVTSQTAEISQMKDLLAAR